MNLCGTGRCCRSRPDRFAKLGKNPGIDRIALRTLVFSVGKVAHPRRLDHTHWLTSLVQRTHQGGFVTTSGFQNHMHFGSSLCLLSISQKLQNASVILGLIGQVVNNSAQMQFECGLGNVDSGVNYGKIIVGNIVLTHTCKCEPRAGASGARSINGSSLEQWMRMPLAPGRIATLTRRMQGAIAAHPHHRRTGCSPCGGLASLPAFADQRNKHSRHTRGDGMLVARFPPPLAGAWPMFMARTGGLRHRLISDVPPGQFESFPAIIRETRSVLVGLRSKTSLNRYSAKGAKQTPTHTARLLHPTSPARLSTSPPPSLRRNQS